MSFSIRKKDSAQPADSAQPKQAAEETKRFNIRKKEEPEGLPLPTLSDTVKKKAKGTAAAGRIRAAELPSAHIQDLKNRQRQAAADLDTEELDRINRELKGLRADAGKQTLGDRVSDVASAVLGGSASSFVNAAGMFGTTAHDPKNNPKQIARMQKALDTGRLDDGKPVTCTPSWTWRTLSGGEIMGRNEGREIYTRTPPGRSRPGTPPSGGGCRRRSGG